MTEYPEINLQWKNTDACYDFWCPCGWEGAEDPNSGEPDNHQDGYFKQDFQCGGCGQWWHLPNRLYARPGKFARDHDPAHPLPAPPAAGRDYGCADCPNGHSQPSPVVPLPG